MKGKIAGKFDKHGIATEINDDPFGLALAQFEEDNKIVLKNGIVTYPFLNEIDAKVRIEKGVVKPRKEFKLSVTELIEATEPRMDVIRELLPDLAIGQPKVESNSLYTGAIVSYDAELPSGENGTIKFDIKTFTSRYKEFGKLGFKHDGITTKQTCNKLKDKYGSEFLAKFVYAKLMHYHSIFLYSGNESLEYYAKKFLRILSIVGVTCDNAEEIIMAGPRNFCFEDFKYFQKNDELE